MTIYYVSGTGSDTNNGLGSGLVAPFSNKPFRSLGRAVYSLQTGGTIQLMNGIYDTGTMMFNFNGSPTLWTTIENYPGDTPQLILKGSGINIFSCSYVLIQGLTLIGNSANISLDYAVSQQNILDNPLTNANGIAINRYTNSAGIGGTTPHHIIIRGNIISNFPGGGVAAIDTDYITVEKNVISGNAWYSPFGCQGLTTLYATNTDNNILDYKIIYSKNIVFNNKSLIPWTGSGTITEGHGIMLDTIQQSRAGVPYLGRSLIANNITYNNGSSGIHAYKSGNVTIINNTSYHNGLVLKLTSGEIDVTYSSYVSATKNIMAATPGQNANILKYCKNVAYINNLVHNLEAFVPSDNLLGIYPNLLGQDPLFQNADAANFSLSSGSPGIQIDGTKWGYEGIVR